jgi:hypothetical protein
MFVVIGILLSFETEVDVVSDLSMNFKCKYFPAAGIKRISVQNNGVKWPSWSLP